MSASLIFALDLEQIDALDRFDIEIKNVRNPFSTETTDSIVISIIDENGNEINSKKKNNLVTTNNAYTIAQSSI